MKMRFYVLAFSLLLSLRGSVAKPAATDLAGNWEGAVSFGKFKFSLILRIATNSAGRLEVTMDMPEQGQSGLRIDALLFNSPDFRLEIDQFGTAYNGKVNAALTEIRGEFEEGPGGRPEPLVFKRSATPVSAEPKLAYTFGPGEAKDARGYWKGELEAGLAGGKVIAALNIGRTPEGKFLAAVDLPEQGAKGIRATSVDVVEGKIRMKWQMQGIFEAALQRDGNELAGPWVQEGRTNSLTFQRLERPLQLVPDGTTFAADPGDARDPRGVWKGALNVPGRKLRLVFKVGRAPDGSYAGTLSSVDQGAQEIPMSIASFQAPTLKMEWRGIRGKYEGKLADDGKSIEGTWEQFGNPMPLTLERTSESNRN